MSMAYAPGEQYASLPTWQFRLALIDPTMLAPSGHAAPTDVIPRLFPDELFGIELGGDDAMTGSNQTVTLPLPNTVITIGTEYGSECSYAGDATTDGLYWIPFTVWVNTGDTHDDVRRRLLFARDARKNVFDSFGLSMVSMMVPVRCRPTSPVSGLQAFDYRWRFWFTRINVVPTIQQPVMRAFPPT